MKQLLGIVLIIAALAFGYLGYTKLEDKDAKIAIGDLEIKAQDKDTKEGAYLMFGLGAVCLIAGLLVAKKP